MSEKNVQIIENASLDDVVPGDHLVWEYTREVDGVTITARREGIAACRYGNVDWYTKDGMWITDSRQGDALTIRRPVPVEREE